MKNPSFFGYGSLVNLNTHNYTNPRPATVPGWRRIWRSIVGRDYAVLSVHPYQATTLSGIIADVPNADWKALDAREAFYVRQSLPDGTAIFEVQEDIIFPSSPTPILRSYLDVVIQGYLHHFGREGVADFFATTDSWASIFDDREAPIYPRHQHVSMDVTSLVDTHLAAMVKKLP